MEITFLFAITALLLAFSEARYKPKLEVYEIRTGDNNDNLQINDVTNQSGDADSLLSKLFKPYKKERSDKLGKHKNEKMMNVVDALISKLKSLRGTSYASDNAPQVYIINGNLIVDEEDNSEHKFMDDTRSVPIILNTRDIIELLGQPHRHKRPILRIQEEDRTAPPPHRFVYDSDGY